VNGTCDQHECDEPGAYRYTWPGKDEALICEGHVGKLRAIADAIGLHIQIIAVIVPE
jgi:hypothetical protein